MKESEFFLNTLYTGNIRRNTGVPDKTNGGSVSNVGVNQTGTLQQASLI